MIGSAEVFSSIGAVLILFSLSPDFHISITFLLSLGALLIAVIVRRMRMRSEWQISLARRIGESVGTCFLLLMALPEYLEKWSISDIFEKIILIWILIVALILISSILCSPHSRGSAK